MYELFDSDEQKPLKAAVKETFEAAAGAYYRGEFFGTAVAHLEQVLAQLPDDPLSHYYLEKARRLYLRLSASYSMTN